MSPGDLPFVDEHSLAIEAPRERVWEALLPVAAGSFEGGRVAELGARILGCREAGSSGPRPLAQGATIPGFRVAEAHSPSRLVLEGGHRFSDYRLVFLVDEGGPGASRLRAQTWAEFPGLHGRAYRAAVIGTRGHVFVVRRLLAAVARRAGRASR